MKALSRKQLLTMTDDEHWKWWGSLSDHDADRLSDRQWKAEVEWWVKYYDSKGNDDVLAYDTLAEAETEYNKLLIEAADEGITYLSLELTQAWRKYSDRDLTDREYTLLREWGVEPGSEEE